MATKYNYAITSPKKLEALLKKDIKIILDQIGNDTCNKLKVYTKQYWYDKYTPQDYVRTQDFLNSISYEVKGMQVMIYFDINKLSHIHKKDKWSAHNSFDGVDFTVGMIEYIETGKFASGKTGSQYNPRFGKGAGMIQKTETWINKYVEKEVKNKLEHKLGVKIRK